MIYPFGAALRELLVRRLAAFTPTRAPETHGLKRAAVAVILVESDDASGETAFVLTRRGRDLRAHKGQYALPGGRCEEGEPAVAAALREVEEELGLRLDADDVLGMLDDYPTRSGYLITPVVIWAGQARPLIPNPEEVAAVHRIPLAEIARAGAVDFITIPESERRVIRIRMNGSLVHAPTAAVVYQFHEVLAGRHTRVGDLEQPVFAWR
ncbi:MAG TPA: CoA pyrophosphatase [Xanthobacteraceae bacterium]|jgi:8-oxo-dGTP pyrophosphatase MutT (NUDIX family)